MPASVTGPSAPWSARSSMAVTAKRPLVVSLMVNPLIPTILLGYCSRAKRPSTGFSTEFGAVRFLFQRFEPLEDLGKSAGHVLGAASQREKHLVQGVVQVPAHGVGIEG